MPPDPPSKERLRRSLVRIINWTHPPVKNPGYGPAATTATTATTNHNNNNTNHNNTNTIIHVGLQAHTMKKTVRLVSARILRQILDCRGCLLQLVTEPPAWHCCDLGHIITIMATFTRPVFVTRTWHSGVLNRHFKIIPYLYSAIQ